MTMSTPKVRIPKPIDPRLKNALLIVGTVLAIVAFTAVILAFISITNVSVTASPLVYTDPSPDAAGSPICAGRGFTFTEEYKIKDGPALVNLYSVVRSAGSGEVQPRVVSGNLTAPESNTLIFPQDVGRTYTRTIVFSDTAALPPGHYEWWRFGRAQGRSPSTYHVSFEVKTCK